MKPHTLHLAATHYTHVCARVQHTPSYCGSHTLNTRVPVSSTLPPTMAVTRYTRVCVPMSRTLPPTMASTCNSAPKKRRQEN